MKPAGAQLGSRGGAIGVGCVLFLGAMVCVGTSAGDAGAPGAARRVCSCEVRSWVVARNGRHLFAKIDCPENADHLDTVVEFTSAALRRDFVGPLDPANLPRIAKMTRGVRLRSQFAGPPDDRLEASFALSVEEARELQRDRMFEEAYVLLGANSNAAMRAALGAVGLELPERVLAGSGATGEFPGIDFRTGDEVPGDRWGAFGVPSGPEPAPDGPR